ncbi:YeiH family protein [Zobellella iuensis]|uniref:YeiH family putative sulfate export transporter n=1 Tax=Zobellella iuensis TaxID=2803811 RepID=A0ABS1QRS7_9GAMM|nr:YeiH family protein [Zobellella iuensis]MBL1377575.1 YeiH family putative sulfate export transporter [Zobellella iuensis]
MLIVIRGIGLAALLAAVSMMLAQQFGTAISPLIFAILIGLVLGNALPNLARPGWQPGLEFCKKRLLRIGVAFYGIHITLQQVAEVGAGALVVDAVMLLSTLALAYWLGRRWLGLDATTSLLVGSGSAICGAAAILATEPVVRAKPQQTTVAVGTVVLFGTLAMFVYPMLYPWLGLSPQAMGIYTGATVHEVAQVVAAGTAMGDDVAQTAVIAKLTRVMMLAPVLLVLGSWLGRKSGTQAVRAPLPWFAFGFIAVVVCNSLLSLPPIWVAIIKHLDTWALTMAMAALGLGTRLGGLGSVGWKPLVLAAILFLHLVVSGLIVTHMATSWL